MARLEDAVIWGGMRSLKNVLSDRILTLRPSSPVGRYSIGPSIATELFQRHRVSDQFSTCSRVIMSALSI